MSDDAQKIWDELDQEEVGGQQPSEKETVEAAIGDDTIASGAEDDATPSYQELLDRVAGLESMLSQADRRLKNAEGHIGGLNAHIRKVQEEVKTKGASAPTAAEVSAARADPEAMAALKRDYPEFAEAMGAALDARLAELEARIPQQVSPQIPENIVTQDDLRQWQNRMYVEAKHEGWEDRVKTPEFAGWLFRQPREVQMLAESDDPRDAVRLLDLHRDATKPRNKSNDQLSSAAALPSGRGGRVTTKSIDDMTPEEYWRYLDEQDRQKGN